MIVLDTNQLDYLHSPHGPLFVLLETIAGRSGDQLALPEMVLTEHLAHHRHRIETQVKAALDAVRALDALDARPHPAFTPPDADQSVKARRVTLQEAFTVLPTPRDAEQEGMQREADRRRPADQAWDKKGAGGRDVVVWLTVLAAMRRLRQDEQMLFVSNDGDFTDKQGRLHPELHDELLERGLEPARLRVYREVTDLLALYAAEAEVPADLDRLLSAATAEPSLTVALGTDAADELRGRLATTLGSLVVTPIGPPKLTLRKRGRTMAYRAGDTTWISARCTWRGTLDFAVLAVDLSTAIPVSPVEYTVHGSVLIRVGPDCPDGAVAMISRERLRIDGIVCTTL